MVLWLITGATLAGDCDVKEIQNRLAEASPVAVPRIFDELVKCDVGAARDTADDAMGRTLEGSEGNQAALAALQVGAPDSVAEWIRGLEPGGRTGAIRFLGEQCQDNETVATFFDVSRKSEGESFWTDRWYRGLGDCRTPVISGLLTDALKDPFLMDRKNRGLFFGVLEVYARNLRASAIPELENVLASIQSENERSIVIRAFADTANVGAAGGTDTAAAKIAREALHRLAPTMQGKPADTFRDTLRALGDDEASESMARHRWPDRFSDTYTYVAAVHELVTCKNDKQQAYFHHGELLEPGKRFRDTIDASLEADLIGPWRLDAAERCKGTSELRAELSPEPIADEASATEWLEAQREAFTGNTSGFSKVEEVEHEAMGI